MTQEALTVCSRPPRRGSSKMLLHAGGDMAVMAIDRGGCRPRFGRSLDRYVLLGLAVEP